jgi:hypothetical protein
VTSLDPMLEALRYAANPPGVPMTKLATVTGIVASGVQLRFDGETSTSARTYRAAGGCRVGDRVLCTRVGSAWVVVGAVGVAAEVPLSRSEGSISAATTLPNDAILRTTHLRTSAAVIPAGATTALVSYSVTAASDSNAAAQWTPLWSTNNGATSWENLLSDRISHNNGQPNTGNGFAVTAAFDVRGFAVGTLCAIACNGWAHSAGGGIWVGNLLYSVTFLGVKP